MLDARRLRVLHAVVRSGTISAAAEQLGYSTSAVSQQIAALERETSTPLLARVGRGVRPTEAGLLLARHAELVIDQLATAEHALAGLRDDSARRLTVQYFATAGAALVVPAVALVRRQLPDLQVELRLEDPADPFARVRDGAVDVALVTQAGRETPRGTGGGHLVDDPFVVILPAEHPLVQRSQVQLGDLADLPWVRSDGVAGASARTLLDACAAAGFTPRYVSESDDPGTAQALVAAGLGVGVMPLLTVARRHPEVAIRPLRDPAPTRALLAVTPDPDPGGLPTRRFTAALQQLVARGPIPAIVATPTRFGGCDARPTANAGGRGAGRETAAVCAPDRSGAQQR